MPKAKSNSQDNGNDDVVALRKALEEANAGRMAAEGRANQMAGRVREAEMAGMSAQERALVAQLEASDSNISSMEGEIQSYEDQIAQLADEPGHGKEIAQLNRKMAQASAKLETESNKKTYLTAQREKFTANKERRAEADEIPAGDTKLPNGALLSTFSPTTQAWLRERPKALVDGAYFDRIVAAAQAAEKIKGLKADTTDFFNYVEDMIGEAPAAAEEEEEEEIPGEEIAEQPARAAARPGEEGYEPERPQRRAAGPGSMAAAAPTRNVPTGSGGTQRRTPTLSAEEREVALNLYAHLNISDADRLKKYADGKKFMANYQPRHFQGPN